MRTRLHWFLALLVCSACGGGGSGGDPDPGPPAPPFATTVNTALAVSPAFSQVAVVGSKLLVPVSELDAFEDRNGDGDTLDDVVACVDTATGEVTNLGFAVIGQLLSTDKSFAFLVREASQGATDLNGDGDSADAVWFVYDPARPIDVLNPDNSGIVAHSVGLPGVSTEGGFVMLESEVARGLDLNGDGDLGDTVVAAYQESVRSRVPLAAGTYAPGTPLVSRNGRVLVATSETLAAADFNRDGDALDIILACVDFHTSTPTLRPVGGLFGRAIGTHPYALTDNAAVYLIDEAGDGGFDLNNDGDATDAVVAVFDIGSGTGEHTPFSNQVPSLGLAADATVGIATSAARAVVAISEPGQGGVDLNGDLDNFDSVVGWIDTDLSPGSLFIQPFAVAKQPIRVSGTNALVAVNEKSDGAIVGVDHNGDGDIDDNVAFMLAMPAPRGTMINLGFASATLDLQGDDALVGVPEAGHFNGDLNGNGVVGDIVTVYFDFGDNPPTQRSLGIVANALSHFRLSTAEVRLAALMPEGQSGNYNDLNGDGDSNDMGVMLLGIDPSTAPPPLLAPTPFFAGTGGFTVAPPVRVGNDVFAFVTAEDMLRQDLNFDGDTLDTVLQYVRYEPPAQ